MRYFHQQKVQFDGLEYPETYDEIDPQMNHIRSLKILPKGLIGSNFPTYINPYSGEEEFTLEEGEFEIEIEPEEVLANIGIMGEDYQEMKRAFDSVKEISRTDFDKKWKEYLNEWSVYWEKVQKIFPVNSISTGKIVCYYPNGIILSLDNHSFGVISREELESLGEKASKRLRVNERIKVKIAGYDANNMWVKLIPVYM